MVSPPNINHDSGKLKDAASLLLRGATLLNDPCPSCTGVQVRFENKNICINCCNLPTPGTQATRRESNFNNQAKMITDKELAKSVIQEKIMLLVQQIRDENDIPSQKIKAELIDLYLRILEKAGALL